MSGSPVATGEVANNADGILEQIARELFRE